jgi:hypothetical protein
MALLQQASTNANCMKSNSWGEWCEMTSQRESKRKVKIQVATKVCV